MRRLLIELELTGDDADEHGVLVIDNMIADESLQHSINTYARHAGYKLVTRSAAAVLCDDEFSEVPT